VELYALFHHHPAIPRSVEGGNDQPHQLPGARGRGKRDNESRRLAREDVDLGRVEYEGANAVSVAIHRHPDALLPFRISVRPGDVGNVNALSWLELSPPHVDRKEPAESRGLETHSRSIGYHLGRSWRLLHFGLRRVPSPKGGRLEEEGTSFGDPEGPGLVRQGEPDSFSGARGVRASGIQMRSTTSVGGMTCRGEVVDQTLVGVEFRVPGPRRLVTAPEEQEQEERPIPPHHYS